MIIDFFKLLLLLCPTFIRVGVISFAESVTAPLQDLYDDFRLWQMDIRLQSSTTCQVLYLETMLNYRLLGSLLRVIYITDGDGISTDFVINVPEGVTYDSSQLNALVNKYKLYGKRFTVGQTNYTYEAIWTGMFCETISAENLLTTHFDTNHVWVTSAVPVKSVLLISIQVAIQGRPTQMKWVTINNETSESNHLTIVDGVYVVSISSVTITLVEPSQDSFYTYTF